ncbi:myosin heavy chain-related [Striga hermonthica]|uniref:Myosin heavy chain-related n=1 Tax=Striga hermonthica TaxID=68872 RepID=A0A9N7RDH0_STRHE|nr:myosin heavy chain-related [Striga hermonthica]
MLRVATMMTVLDTVRDRIQKCQSFRNRSSGGPELRRCITMIPRPSPSRPDRPNIVDDEKESLRRELVSSLASQRNLQDMFERFRLPVEKNED